MDDLMEFLRARLDSAEGRYRNELKVSNPNSLDYNESYIVAEAKFALADIAAKRRILDDCVQRRSVQAVGLLKLLALPYADHPDYRQEWRA